MRGGGVEGGVRGGGCRGKEGVVREGGCSEGCSEVVEGWRVE